VKSQSQHMSNGSQQEHKSTHNSGTKVSFYTKIIHLGQHTTATTQLCLLTGNVNASYVSLTTFTHDLIITSPRIAYHIFFHLNHPSSQATHHTPTPGGCKCYSSDKQIETHCRWRHFLGGAECGGTGRNGSDDDERDGRREGRGREGEIGRAHV